MLEIHKIDASNLPDAARLCLAGKTLGDRPRAFTREVEVDSTRCKLSLLREKMARGSGGYAAYRSGMLVGYVEFHPVEESLLPIRGADCFAIQCLRVPELQERAEVEHALVEKVAAHCGNSRGVAVLAREKEWGGALGFEEAEREASEITGYERVLWWRQCAAGDKPTLAPIERRLPKIPGKVRVDLFTSERCPWDKYVFDLVRGMCERMKPKVVLYETDCMRRKEVLRSGISAGIAVNGAFQPWLRPFRLADEHTVRRTLEDAI